MLTAWSRRFATGSAVCLLSALQPAAAAEVLPFSTAVAEAAIQQARPIVYHVHATWCTVCAWQNRVLDGLLQDPAFNTYLVLKVDIDKQPGEMAALQVKERATLIVARGATERGRSTGVTDTEQIRALLLKARD